MASQEQCQRPEKPLLRSTNNDISTFVKFVNRTDRTVYLFWFGYDGKIVNYGTLGPRRINRMDTYVTHPWIAKDSVTAFTLLMNGQTVFFPREHVNGVPFEPVNRDVINIHIPVFTLLQRCAEVVNTHFGKKKLKSLDVPRELKETIANISRPFYDRNYAHLDEYEEEYGEGREEDNSDSD